jgi:hypothetical protein
MRRRSPQVRDGILRHLGALSATDDLIMEARDKGLAFSIGWSLSGARLNLEWRESDGPVITTPTYRGFGTRLVSRALDQFGGVVETGGLICIMTVTLSGRTSSIVPDIVGTEPKVFLADWTVFDRRADVRRLQRAK